MNSFLAQSHSFFKIFSVRIALAASLEKKKVNLTCFPSEKEEKKRKISLFLKEKEERKRQISVSFTKNPSFCVKNYKNQFASRDKNFASFSTQLMREPFQYEKPTFLHFPLTIASFHFFMKKREANSTYWQFEQKSDYKIFRPLLTFSRGDITCFCQSLKLPVYPDKSNQIIYYSRNKIRKQIFPSLQLFLNPQVENSLFQFAEWVTQEKFLLTYE